MAKTLCYASITFPRLWKMGVGVGGGGGGFGWGEAKAWFPYYDCFNQLRKFSAAVALKGKKLFQISDANILPIIRTSRILSLRGRR